MSKYSNELKIMIVKTWISGAKSSTELIPKYGIGSDHIIREWCNKHQITGSIGSASYKTYTPEFKMQVINYYLSGHSCSETSRHFAVFPGTTIANWLSTYRKFGYNGLKPKPKGKQPTMGRKRIHPLTPEQQELVDLKEENYQLRMENAILKKLKALVNQRTEKNKRQ